MNRWKVLAVAMAMVLLPGVVAAQDQVALALQALHAQGQQGKPDISQLLLQIEQQQSQQQQLAEQQLQQQWQQRPGGVTLFQQHLLQRMQEADQQDLQEAQQEADRELRQEAKLARRQEHRRQELAQAQQDDAEGAMAMQQAFPVSQPYLADQGQTEYLYQSTPDDQADQADQADPVQQFDQQRQNQQQQSDQADQQIEQLRQARSNLFPHSVPVPRPTLPPPFCLNQPGGC